MNNNGDLDGNNFGIKNPTKEVEYKEQNGETLHTDTIIKQKYVQQMAIDEIREVNPQDLRKKKTIKALIIIISSTLLIGLIIFLSVYLTKNHKEKKTNDIPKEEPSENIIIEEESLEESKNKDEESKNPIIIDKPEVLTKEEAMKAFVSNFNMLQKKTR